MKTNKLIILTLVLFLDVGVLKATHYIVEDGDFFSTIALFNNDTLLMTGGNGETLTLGDNAIATIENTDIPIGIVDIISGGDGIVNIIGGGIGDIEAINESTVNMTGGSVNSLEMYYQSESYLYGGAIGTLASDQPSGYPLPQNWIHFYCLEYDYDSNNNLLTGFWCDSSPFSVQLEDIGTIPTYEQIEFHIIPEPATGFLLIAGLFGVLLKNKKTAV